MAIDSELLDILVCPKSRGELRLVKLDEPTCASLVEKFREHFRDEEPEVSQGLYCETSELIYPIVSDIPVLLEDEAIPASAVEHSPV